MLERSSTTNFAESSRDVTVYGPGATLRSMRITADRFIGRKRFIGLTFEAVNGLSPNIEVKALHVHTARGGRLLFEHCTFQHAGDGVAFAGYGFLDELSVRRCLFRSLVVDGIHVSMPVAELNIQQNRWQESRGRRRACNIPGEPTRYGLSSSQCTALGGTLGADPKHADTIQLILSANRDNTPRRFPGEDWQFGTVRIEGNHLFFPQDTDPRFERSGLPTPILLGFNSGGGRARETHIENNRIESGARIYAVRLATRYHSHGRAYVRGNTIERLGAHSGRPYLLVDGLTNPDSQLVSCGNVQPDGAPSASRHGGACLV